MNSIRKRSRLQTLFIFILIFLSSLWTAVNTARAQEGLQPKAKKNFLWAVKGNNTTIYLLGSIHLLKSDSYPLDRRIEDAYRDCKKIVFETDIDALKDPSIQVTMQNLALYPEGQTLKQNLSPQTYSLLEKKVVAAGLPMDHLNRFKPWFCGVTLTALELQRLGFDPQYGVDAYFFTKAKKDGKEMIFLETVEYQLELFAEVGDYDEESLLRQMLKDLEVVETMLSGMVSAWENGDAAKFESIFGMSFKDYPNVYNRFVIQRNREWINKLEDLLGHGGTALVVVGAGHLVGPENVLQLLKNRGYTITQIASRGKTAAMSVAHALYIKSGVKEQIRHLPRALQAGFDQLRTQDTRFQKIPQEVYADIRGRIAEAFVTENFNEIILQNIEAQMSHHEMQGILNWFNSPLGKKCMQLLNTSSTPKATAEIQAFVKKSQESPPPSARMELMRELASATKMIETTVEIAVNTRLAIETAHAMSSPSTGQKPFSKIFEEVDRIRPQLEPMIRQQLVPGLIYIYRSLSDAELRQYIAFAKSSVGMKYYATIADGIREALLDGSIRFGSSMADMVWKRRQGVRSP